MPRASNKKGGEFERWVCRRLTAWASPAGVERPEWFWRSSTSGAKATQDAAKGRRTVMGGDIMSIVPEAGWFTSLFSIECKNRHDYGNLDLILWNMGDFQEWWAQCVRDANRDRKQPLMIVKRYQRPVLIAYWQTTGLDRVAQPPLTHICFEGDAHLGPIIVCNFDDWMEQYPARRMKEAMKRKHLERV